MKTLIEMAREAGLITNAFGDVHGDMYHLERFAALVREDEREKQQEPVAWIHWVHAPTRVFMNKDEAMLELNRLNREYPLEKDERKLLPVYTTTPTIEAAVLDEREACAKVCDELSTLWYDEGGSANDCAAAIRARG